MSGPSAFIGENMQEAFMKRILSMLAAGAIVATAATTAPANATMRSPDIVNPAIQQVDHRRWDHDDYWKPRHHWRPRHHSRYWRRHHQPRFGFFFFEPRYHRYYPRDSYYYRD